MDANKEVISLLGEVYNGLSIEPPTIESEFVREQAKGTRRKTAAIYLRRWGIDFFCGIWVPPIEIIIVDDKTEILAPKPLRQKIV